MINNFVLILKQKVWAYKKLKFRYKKLIKGPYKK
jgi:hypothetical protein